MIKWDFILEVGSMGAFNYSVVIPSYDISCICVNTLVTGILVDHVLTGDVRFL